MSHINRDQEGKLSVQSMNSQLPLDASFVHLPTPRRPSHNNTNRHDIFFTSNNHMDYDEVGTYSLYEEEYNDNPFFNNGILSSHKYMTSLLKVTEQSLQNFNGTKKNNCDEETGNETSTKKSVDDKSNAGGELIRLCENDIQRIRNAIDENTEQMKMETQAYIRAVEEEKDNQRRTEKALCINMGIQDMNHHFDEKDDITKETIQSLHQEILNLENACQEYEQEIMNLDQLLFEQAHISNALSTQEDELMIEYNTLEKDTKVFEDLHRQLFKQCHAAERERAQLHLVRLNSTLFDFVIDKEGGRYPLINNLRLSHIPTDNLHWSEINAAWSQAAQLIMFMSSTIKFRSNTFGLVPLSQCAKIIEVDSFGKKIYHHLGVDYESMDRRTHNTEHIVPSVVMFYRLFYQIILHLRGGQVRSVNLSEIPHEMSRDNIGSFEIQNKNEHDEKLWRGIINCIAQNLKWLSFQL